MRYLSRDKVYEKVASNKDAKKVFIFCEGEYTEIKYFNYFRGFSSNIDIIAIPSVNGQSDPTKLQHHASLLFEGDEHTTRKFSLSEEYQDEVWFVIDTDRWNEGNKISQLREFCTQKNKELSTRWFVAQSNPCFEVWLYYHFNSNMPDSEVVATFDSFKHFLNSVIKGGFDCRCMPIEIEDAIKHSKINFASDGQQPKLFSTEAHFLGEVIMPFIKDQLLLARSMAQGVGSIEKDNC